ncbi:solute carrier family 12 member 2-like isoform X1 [Haliotis asinina]|uniref:solute carrier family 12 member 2-like isoform X1 n=1 Tax=Haliotis asinina TaxID=109174 RepID=UPI0035321999
MAHMESTEPGEMKKAELLVPGSGEGDEIGEEMKKSGSRFQVARVDCVNETKFEEPPKDTKSNVHDKGPESPSATFSLSGDSFRSYSDTNNLKTFAMNTHEALPCVDHYRNILSATGGMKSRPTLAQLHEEMDDEEIRGRHKDPLLVGEERLVSESTVAITTDKKPQQGALKFGWIKGVLVRCLLNIWGVMLFIRLSWVVGQAGMGLTAVIILLSAVVTTLTALSMSAICTNGEVKGGGAYYMISRSLGAEFGGAIGLIFSVANAVAIAMYVVGFAETVRDLLKNNDALMVDETNDIRIIGFITISLLLAIAIIGMDWEARAQLILLAVLVIGLVNFLVGCVIPPTEAKKVKGFVGFSSDLFIENMLPAFREGEEFFSVFSVFFPAATGILAGANISGDLKDAQTAIPKGTLLSILISTIVYLGVAWTLGSCMLRDAVGPLNVAVGATTVVKLSNVTTTVASVVMSAAQKAPNTSSTIVYTEDVIQNCSLAKNGLCAYGLMNDYQAMEMISGFGPLITAGIFSATLSSALASLVSAPKVFQAVCKDEIFPKIHFFAKGYGIDDGPRRAYLLAYFIGLGFVFIGDLNAIAPVISNFFLMSYTLINYSCFDASLARSPGWRPAFRFYNKWCSLLGALICLAVMFIINWWTALITFGVISALFIYVHHTKPEVNWGSSTQAHVYRNALQSSLKLVSVEDHIKNFRPQVLVMSGLPENRPALIDFVSHISKKISLMVCANVIVGPQSGNLKKLLNTNAAYSWLSKRRVKAFYTATTSPSFRLGAQSIMHTVGVGKLRPNTLIMGFKSDWTKCEPSSVEEYFKIIHDAFDLNYGVGLLRLQEGFGLDVDMDTTFMPDGMTEDDGILSLPNRPPEMSDDDLTPDDTPPHQLHSSYDRIDNSTPMPSKSANLVPGDIQNGPSKSREKLNIEVLKGINMFKRHPKKGTIDVWWLFDDGGLTLLIPYILTTKAHWRGCKLRVFTAGTKKGELDREQRQMATLLSKFRIECKDMTVLPDVNKAPREESQMEFKNLVSDWVLDTKAGETEEKFPWKTTQEEMELLKDKTNRHIRLRELMLEKSRDASLIVMTLPMPRKGTCSAGLYMSWIDTLTRDMPPILLLRGNQTSVLTFYS